MAFANLTARLTADIKDFSAKMTTAMKQADNVKSKFTSGISSKANSWVTYANSLSDKYKEASKALTTHNLGLKDTSRIIQGIMVSQVFYGIVQSIRSATSALWEFNKELDYANVTYSALFGSTELASDFMLALKEHSIKTIFDYQDLAGMSKKLLAYGMDYQNLLFVMEGLTNLGAMSGDAASLDRIALAIGQIYTKGKLGAEEMRQLANAYVPISDIIKEEFQLSEEDMGRIGDLNLPAEQVINAIVDYANERFSGVGDAAMMTITGLQNKIVDTLKVVGVEMFAPISNAYKSFLLYVSNGLENIRNEFATGGIGGVFEYLVPDEGTQQTIRQFIANVINAFRTLKNVATVAGKVIGSFAQVFVTAFNLLAPVVLTAVDTITYFLNELLNTRTGATVLRTALLGAAAAFVVLRVQAAYALIVTTVTSAIQNLSKALVVLGSIITKHPIVAILSLLAVGLTAVALSSDKAKKAFSSLSDSFSGLTGGSTSGGILQPVEKEIKDSTAAAEQFNNRLEEGKSAVDALNDSINGTGKAAKKAAGLLSFDEVYKLNEQKDASGSGGALGAIDDLIDAIGGLGGNIAGGLEIPDFTEYASNFATGLWGALNNALGESGKSAGIGATIGTVIGGVLGSIFGGAGGIKIGAFLGGAAGGLVGWLEEELGIGGDGAAIGGIGGLIFSVLKNVKIDTSSLSGFFKSIGSALKNGGWKNIVKGGLVGIVIGWLNDLIHTALWTWLSDDLGWGGGDSKEEAKLGQAIGGTIGSIVGGFFGPAFSVAGLGAGSTIGGFIGLFFDDLVGRFTSGWKKVAEENGLSPDAGTIASISARLSSIAGSIIGSAFGPLGTLIGGYLGNGIGGAISLVWTETWPQLKTWWSDTYSGFTTWWSDTTSGFTTWWSDTSSGFTTWWSDTTSGLATWWSDTVAIFSDWENINGETLQNWWTDTKDGFTTWWSDTTSGLDTWWSDTTSGFTTWWSDTTSGFTTWWTDTKAGFSEWAGKVYSVFKTWAANNLGAVVEWVKNTARAIAQWAVDTWNNFIQWAGNVYNKFREFKTDVVNVIKGFAIAAALAVAEWAEDTKQDIVEGIEGWTASIKSTWESIWNPATWKSGWSSIKSWFSDLLDDIKNYFIGPNGLKSKISGWWDSLWDGKEVNLTTSTSGSGTARASLKGHAAGGIFNREHIARFAENNRAEAIIPLENASAMRPFVDAVSDGLVSTLAPIVAQVGTGNASNLPPLYVGTLIADDRGLKELYKKFEVIQLQENERRGIPTGVYAGV